MEGFAERLILTRFLAAVEVVGGPWVTSRQQGEE
jgi:hypothetical protein